MKTLYRLLLCLPLTALAGEELPDSAPVQDDADAGAMSERFAAPPMDSQEMQSLYLKSPVQLENVEERSGMESLSDENRYKESDLLFRERQSSDQLLPVPILEPEGQSPGQPDIPVIPMRQL